MKFNLLFLFSNLIQQKGKYIYLTVIFKVLGLKKLKKNLGQKTTNFATIQYPFHIIILSTLEYLVYMFNYQHFFFMFGQLEEEQKTQSMVCQLCSKHFSTENAYQNHIQSKKHRELAAKALQQVKTATQHTP